MPLSSHATRWLIAAIAVPVLLWVILAAPPWALWILVGTVGAVAVYEYWSMAASVEGKGLLAMLWLGFYLTLAGAALFSAPGLAAGMSAGTFCGGLYLLFRSDPRPEFVDRMGRLTLGLAWVGLPLGVLLLVDRLPQGPAWVIFCLLVSFIGDTSAYYTGRAFGRHKLFPKVSPKKTWEGLAGNVLGCGLAAGLYAAAFLPVIWWEAAALGGFLGLWGAGGDLFESMLKRSIGIKDSGRILLGHGGILDRIDALLFNIPLIYFFAVVRGG